MISSTLDNLKILSISTAINKDFAEIFKKSLTISGLEVADVQTLKKMMIILQGCKDFEGKASNSLVP